MCDQTALNRLEDKIDKLGEHFDEQQDKLWSSINSRRDEQTNNAVEIARLQGRADRLEDRWSLAKWGVGVIVASIPILLGIYHLLTNNMR